VMFAQVNRCVTWRGGAVRKTATLAASTPVLQNDRSVRAN
jgi:hypothetical protein